MTWNRIIDRTKQVVSFQLGNRSHSKTNSKVIALKIVVLVNDDAVPLFWTVEGNAIQPGQESRGILDFLELL